MGIARTAGRVLPAPAARENIISPQERHVAHSVGRFRDSERGDANLVKIRVSSEAFLDAVLYVNVFDLTRHEPAR